MRINVYVVIKHSNMSLADAFLNVNDDISTCSPPQLYPWIPVIERKKLS